MAAVSLLMVCRAVQWGSRGFKHCLKFWATPGSGFFWWYYNVRSALWNEIIDVKLNKPQHVYLDYLWVYCHLPCWRPGNILSQQFFMSFRQCKIKRKLVKNRSLISDWFIVLGAMYFGATYYWFWREMLHFVGAKHRLIQRSHFRESLDQLGSENQFVIKWVKWHFEAVV